VSAEGGFLTPRSRRLTRPLMSGSAKRARPRLIRVRLADNLRGAPGGPADPNGTSGVRLRRTDGPTGHHEARHRATTREARDPVVLGLSRLPFLPAGSHSMRVGGTPTGVIHSLPQWSSGRAGGSGSRSSRQRELSPARWFAAYAVGASLCCDVASFKFAGSDENSQSGQPRGPHQNTKSTDSAVLRAIVSGASVVPTRRS